MINVNADLFRAAALFVSAEKTRYYLQGVYVAPWAAGGAVLVATDGHRLFAAHDVAGACDTAAIVKLDKATLAACKRGKNETDVRRVTLAPGESRAWILAGDRQAAFADDVRIDGTFPDWRRILPMKATTDAPDADTLTVGAYNADYLASFGAASKIINDSRTPRISVRHGARNGPAFIGVDSNIAFGLLMPMRVAGDTDRPAWLDMA